MRKIRSCFVLLVLLLVPALLFARSRKSDEGEPSSVAELLQGLTVESPALWPKGMPFIFLNHRVGLSLTPEVPSEVQDTTDVQGSRWQYDSMVSEEDWMGQQLLQLRFVSPDGHAYRYSTGRPFEAMADTSYRPALAIMYPEQLILQTDSLLRARTFYILYNDERVIYPADTLPGVKVHQKFIPVVIDSVSYGTELAPLRVSFTKGDEHGYFFASLPGSRQNATSTSLARFLSMSDPFEQHPDITPETWSKIQYSQVQLEMTTEEVRLAWGRPSRIEKGGTRNGVVEYWYYSNNRILQFWDGRLNKIGIL